VKNVPSSWTWNVGYTDETEHNGGDTLTLEISDTMLGDEKVVERTELADKEICIVTQYGADDNNKLAQTAIYIPVGLARPTFFWVWVAWGDGGNVFQRCCPVDPMSTVKDLLYGRWRSQILHAGVRLGILDAASEVPKSSTAFARELQLDAALTYRLMRALASIGLLEEHPNHTFAVTGAGALLQRDNPKSLRGLGLLVDSPVHYAIWKHLIPIVKDGKQDGFVREYGRSAFAHAEIDREYAEDFDAGMSSYSRSHSAQVLEMLEPDELQGVTHICDVGGGQGHLLCQILLRYPHLSGTLVERASTLEDEKSLWKTKLGLGDRCRLEAGDMFSHVPTADAYIMKMILHDWDDNECVDILRVQFDRASAGGRIYIIEHVIPGPETPHFSKLFDIHMMCWGTGRERTSEEYAELLERAGWTYRRTRYAEGAAIGIVEGFKSLSLPARGQQEAQ